MMQPAALAVAELLQTLAVWPPFGLAIFGLLLTLLLSRTIAVEVVPEAGHRRRRLDAALWPLAVIFSMTVALRFVILT